MAGSGTAHLRDPSDAALRVEDLVVEFPAGRGRTVHAVSGISFDVLPGETLGVIGESGCGKSSAGRAVMQLPPPTSGSVRLDGVELTGLGDAELRRTRTRMQMIYQDPISSLNPRRTTRDIVGEGIAIQRPTGLSDADVDEMLRSVGLDPDIVGDRRPHQFSGGQCQRICIARALLLSPKVVICDEPVSALDVSVQAQILNLLEEMKVRYGLSMVFIAHDLAVVKHISDRIVVMYLGKICEVARPNDLHDAPAHPYTRLLLDSVPQMSTDVPLGVVRSSGDIPSPIDPPSGCRFRSRCPNAQPVCASDEPQIREIADGHFVACHFPAVATAEGIES